MGGERRIPAEESGADIKLPVKRPPKEKPKRLPYSSDQRHQVFHTPIYRGEAASPDLVLGRSAGERQTLLGARERPPAERSDVDLGSERTCGSAVGCHLNQPVAHSPLFAAHIRGSSSSRDAVVEACYSGLSLRVNNQAQSELDDRGAWSVCVASPTAGCSRRTV